MNQTVKKILEELADENEGKLSAQGVLDFARPDDSPLHAFFEWDDTVAAEKHRLDQARTLIRSVKVVFIDPDDVRRQTRRFLSVRADDETKPSYRKVEDVRADPRLAEIALRQAIRDWKRMFDKFKDVEAFMAVVRNDLGEIDV